MTSNGTGIIFERERGGAIPPTQLVLARTREEDDALKITDLKLEFSAEARSVSMDI